MKGFAFSCPPVKGGRGGCLYPSGGSTVSEAIAESKTHGYRLPPRSLRSQIVTSSHRGSCRGRTCVRPCSLCSLRLGGWVCDGFSASLRDAREAIPAVEGSEPPFLDVGDPNVAAASRRACKQDFELRLRDLALRHPAILLLQIRRPIMRISRKPLPFGRARAKTAILRFFPRSGGAISSRMASKTILNCSLVFLLQSGELATRSA